MQPILGIALKVLSALAFTAMSAVIKAVSDRYPVGELVFFRSAFAMVPLAIWLAATDTIANALRTRDVRGHLLRGIIGSGGMFCGFAAISFLPLSDAVAIGYAAPLIVVVLAAVLLKEKVRAYRWSAVVVGFVGVLVMLTPHLATGAATGGLSEGPALGVLFALLGACCAAGATIQVRRLTATETTGAIVFYFSLLTTLLGLSTIVLGWEIPGAVDFAFLALAGILGGIGQILLTQSYRFADASLVAPFEYTTMIWALLIGWFWFGDWPAPVVLAGAATVAGAGIFVLWRERRLGLARREAAERAAQRPA